MSQPDPAGQCDWCDRPAVCSVNGLRSCQSHLDDMFNLALAPIRALLRNHRGEKS